MQDYCGKNGCLEFEPGDDFEGELLSVFLNSPITYVIDEHGKSVRAVAGERPDADVSFELFEDTDGAFYTGRMVVSTLFSHGVKEFVQELLKHEEDIADKDGLVAVIKDLLDAEDTEWGKIHPDPEGEVNLN